VLRQVKPRGPKLVFGMNPETIQEQPSVGSWEEIARPRARPMLTFVGRSLRRVSFSLVFDRYDERKSVEDEIDTLKGFGQPRAPGRPPPELELDYGPLHRERWVLTGMQITEEARNGKLRRCYAVVEIELTEYEDVDLIGSNGKGGGGKSPAKRANENRRTVAEETSSPSASGQTATVQAGQTLASIAAQQLGDYTAWPEIAALNGIRDPNRVRPGQTIRLPVAVRGTRR